MGDWWHCYTAQWPFKMLLAAVTRLQWPPEPEKLHAALGENKISDSQWRSKAIQCFSTRYWQWHHYSGSCSEKKQTLWISASEMSAAETALKTVLGVPGNWSGMGIGFSLSLWGTSLPHHAVMAQEWAVRGWQKTEKRDKREWNWRKNTGGETRSWD